MKRWKILHQHLIKCGGTSLNAFLDTQYYANRVHEAESTRVWRDAAHANHQQRFGGGIELYSRLAEHRLRLYDCVHGHNPMAWAAPESFSKVTVLRNPIDRVLSQIRDWKRLEEHDQNATNESNNEFRRFCKKASLSEILAVYDRAPIGARNLSNMQAKLLAASHLGNNRPVPTDEQELRDEALAALDDYDVVGITEAMPDFYQHLCLHMGWCPPRGIEHRNRTNLETLDIYDHDIESLQELNCVDLELYQTVCERLKLNDGAAAYDVDSFELEYASQRATDLAPVFMGDRTFRFDFNMPIIGNGLHGRDAPNTSETAVWTGPGKVSSLFFPVMPLTSMTLQFGIKGYADMALRKGMRWWVDGVEQTHRLVDAKGLADCVEISHVPERDFVRVDLQLPDTVSGPEDPRRRGISLLWYGYRLSQSG